MSPPTVIIACLSIIIIIAILVGMIWALVILICIALKTNNDIFVCLMAICKSFNKYTFSCFVCFQIELFWFVTEFFSSIIDIKYSYMS